MLILVFIVLQIILFFFMAFHDWVHLPPFTDIRALEKYSTIRGRMINSIIFGFLIAIPLFLTINYQGHFTWGILFHIFLFYAFLSLGTILSWWVPYIFGSSAKHKEAFAEYRHTHHFLPARGDNVVPNTFHVILHLQIWACTAIAIYLLIKYCY